MTENKSRKKKSNRIKKVFAGMLLSATIFMGTPVFAQNSLKDDLICREFAELNRIRLYAENEIGAYSPKFTVLDFGEQSKMLRNQNKFENYLVVKNKGREIVNRYGIGADIKCLEDLKFWEEMKKELKEHEPAIVKEIGEKSNEWRDVLKFIITVALLYAFLKNIKAD